MLTEDYVEARELSANIARAVGLPRFCIERQAEIDRSLALFAGAPLVEKALRLAAGYGDCLGHGQVHTRKVAIDTGALVLIERAGDPDLPRLVLLAHLAGLLHDIRRSEKDHARRGAEEAARILEAFPLSPGEGRAISQAIGNHEAFQAYETLDDPQAELLSNALYDADKFRWGPDNFTKPCGPWWSRRSLAGLLAHFPPGWRASAKSGDLPPHQPAVRAGFRRSGPRDRDEEHEALMEPGDAPGG